MKSTIFWGTTPCSPLKVNRRFEGTYRLHFLGYIPDDGILHNHRCENLKSYIVFLYGEATHRHIQALLATYFHVGFLLGLFFDPEDRGDMFLRNVG
jgi:hypothetical protein